MFADLFPETPTLIQHERQLAKIEMLENAAKTRKGASLVTGGGLIADGGVLAVIASVVLVLIAVGLPPWGAALLAGVLAAGVGYLLVQSGLAALRSQELAPRNTFATLREDLSWLKTQPK
jgi:hypothetical protein